MKHRRLKKDLLLAAILSMLITMTFSIQSSQTLFFTLLPVFAFAIVIYYKHFVSKSAHPELYSPLLSGQAQLDALQDQAKEEYMATVLHQLKTPLTGINWALKMIINGEMGSINDEQRKYLSETFESNQRAMSIIKDILDMNKIESVADKRIDTDIRRLVATAMERVKGNADAKHINLTVDGLHKNAALSVDESKILIVLENLLDNAIKYTPQGGDVSVNVEVESDDVVVNISDNGIGIPKDQQAHIFTKFFRATNAVKNEPQGSGIGLAVSKQIVEEHGGKMWFESDEGKGTTFHLALPAVPKQ